jgi:N-acetylmuramic acid 6-phosphate (MurNAc-6-P) etherase
MRPRLHPRLAARRRRRLAQQTKLQKRALETVLEKTERGYTDLHRLITETGMESKDAQQALELLEGASGYLERAIKHPGGR